MRPLRAFCSCRRQVAQEHPNGSRPEQQAQSPTNQHAQLPTNQHQNKAKPHRRRAYIGKPAQAGAIISDIRLKHDIVLLGRLDDGLGFYRFSYSGSHKAYVGVMAQDVETVMPEAVMRGRDGYLKVSYEKLGLSFQTYRQWIAAGAKIPSGVQVRE